MKKGLVFLLFAVILLFASLSMINSAKIDSNAKIDNAVYEKLQHENARVIIKYKSQDATAKTFFSVSSADITDSQIKRKIANGEISAEISYKDLQMLKSNPQVESVKIDYLSYVLLQDSVPLINATLVMPIQVNGINLTGEGQTACVIDTGINRTHPYLIGGVVAEYCFCSVSDSGSGGCCHNNQTEDTNATDDHGHGTHVAGIIAANGSVTGVAPGARIVALKVFNSSGTSANSDIFSALDFCIQNASRYNISVISMSFGGSYLYPSYCDSNTSDNSDDYAKRINNATALNISIVVSAGNSFSTTRISSPACIRNATSVGGTTKADAVDSSYSNRNNITTVLAPGTLITSTWLTGTVAASGTSMSCPHVSGAILLLRQFKKLEGNKNISNANINNAINSTGKRISDSGSGLTFSRLNVFAALVSIDETAPFIGISQPQNMTHPSNLSLALNFSASDNLNLSDCWYSLDSAANISLQNCANTTFNTTEGGHKLDIYANDSAGNLNHTNVTFSVDSGYYSIPACANISSAGKYTLNTSINNSANTAVCINITASDVEIDCVDFSKWIDGSDTALTYGIKAEGIPTAKLNNITVRNCNLTDWHSGIYYNFVENSTIANITSLSSSSFGLFINSSSANKISNITAGSTSDSGILLSSGANYNTLTNITAINNVVYGIYILYQSNHNWVSRAAFVNNSGGFVSSSSINNTLVNATYSNNTGADVNATDTSIDLRNILIQNYSFKNTTIILGNTSSAVVNFPNITVTNGTNLSSDVVLRNNYIFVNSSSALGLNKSANISFYSLSFNNPRILRNGLPCESLSSNLSLNKTCSKISYASANGTLIFNVTGFSSYSAEDYCGNGYCDNGEGCSSCSADCGACSVSTSSGGGGGGGGGSSAKTYNEGALKEGRLINRLLGKNDRIKFELNGNEHNLTLKIVGKDNATFELNSSYLNFNLFSGDSRKFNLTDAEFYDFSVVLNSISNSKANLSILAIRELIKPKETSVLPEETEKNETDFENVKPGTTGKFSSVKYALGILAFSVLAAIFIILLIQNKYRKSSRKKNRKKQGHKK